MLEVGICEQAFYEEKYV